MANLKATPQLQTVTVAIVGNRDEGQRIQKILGAEGMDSFLTAERSVPVKKRKSGEHGAIKVQVARSDVEKAIKALGAQQLAGRAHSEMRPDGPHPKEPPSSRRRRRDLTVPTIVAALLVLSALVLILS